MVELPKNIREFLFRDMIYIVGGGIVLTSFLYIFDYLPDRDTPLAFYLLAAGVAYVVGNVLQDVFSILRLVTTAHVTKMRQPWKWFYKRFYAEEWKDIEDFDPTKARKAIIFLRNNNLTYAAFYERAIYGLILAATMAPCALISSLIVLSQWLVCRKKFDFWISVTSFVLSVVLFVLARLRAAQVTRIDSEAIKEYRSKL